MVRSIAEDLPEQVKNKQSVNLAAGNGGQKMSQYSWFTVYDGKLFFDTYNIPYQIITRGTNAGKLRVKQSRSYDSSKVLEVRRLLTEQGYGILCDHSNVFRDENERTVVTFSPYHDISPDVAGEIYLPGYNVEMSDLSIYGYGTKTVVVIRAM